MDREDGISRRDGAMNILRRLSNRKKTTRAIHGRRQGETNELPVRVAEANDGTTFEF